MQSFAPCLYMQTSACILYLQKSAYVRCPWKHCRLSHRVKLESTFVAPGRGRASREPSSQRRQACPNACWHSSSSATPPASASTSSSPSSAHSASALPRKVKTSGAGKLTTRGQPKRSLVRKQQPSALRTKKPKSQSTARKLGARMVSTNPVSHSPIKISLQHYAQDQGIELTTESTPPFIGIAR